MSCSRLERNRVALWTFSFKHFLVVFRCHLHEDRFYTWWFIIYPCTFIMWSIYHKNYLILCVMMSFTCMISKYNLKQHCRCRSGVGWGRGGVGGVIGRGKKSRWMPPSPLLAQRCHCLCARIFVIDNVWYVFKFTGPPTWYVHYITSCITYSAKNSSEELLWQKSREIDAWLRSDFWNFYLSFWLARRRCWRQEMLRGLNDIPVYIFWVVIMRVLM